MTWVGGGHLGAAELEKPNNVFLAFAMENHTMILYLGIKLIEIDTNAKQFSWYEQFLGDFLLGNEFLNVSGFIYLFIFSNE